MNVNFTFLNSKFEQIRILDDYISLIWTDRYYDVGDFEIYSAVTNDMLSMLAIEDNDELYLWNPESEHIMIIERYEIKTDFDSGDKLIITGYSAESILKRRIIWDKTVIKGSLQDGIAKLVNDAIIAPSNSKRKISNFIFEKSSDPRITAMTEDREFHGENLLDAIREMCEKHKLGFKVILRDDTFVMTLYLGADRSYAQIENPYVVFASDFDNLSDSNYLYSKEEHENVIAVSSRSGEEDIYVEYDPFSVGGLARREGTSSDTVSEDKTVESIGKEDISEKRVKVNFDGQVESTNMYAYQKDFNIGDIVQFRNAYGIEAASIIVEIIVNVTDDEYNVYPTFESIEEKG